MSDLYPYAQPVNPKLAAGDLRAQAYKRLMGVGAQVGDGGDSTGAVTNILNGVNLSGPAATTNMWNHYQQGNQAAHETELGQLQAAYAALRKKAAAGSGRRGGSGGGVLLPPPPAYTPYLIQLDAPMHPILNANMTSPSMTKVSKTDMLGR